MHHYNGPGGMKHGFMSHGMMGYSWIWIIGIILILVLVLVGFLLLFRRSKETTSNKQNRALMILQERFAKGEITEEQYLNKKRVLDDSENG